MKNTVQRYCFFAYPPNILPEKYVLQHVFRFFVKSSVQKSGIFAKNFAISKNSSNFVPERVGHFLWTYKNGVLTPES